MSKKLSSKEVGMAFMVQSGLYKWATILENEGSNGSEKKKELLPEISQNVQVKEKREF